MTKKKNIDIIFLIQRSNKLGYKDIDHILPFLHFLSKSSKLEYKARGFIFDNEENYIKDLDPRVELISKMKNVEIKYLYKTNFIDKLENFPLLKINLKFFKILNSLLNKLKNKIYKNNLSKINWQNKVGKKFFNSHTPLIFTLIHNEDIFLNIISKIKKINKKAKWIVLPHGTTICDNKMVHDSHLSKNEKRNKNNAYSKIDYIFKTSRRDYIDAVANGLKKTKGKVIGSPRFCREWLKLKSDLQLDGKKIAINEKKKIRILFLLPKKYINVFTEELIRTIDFLSSYAEFEIKTVNYYNYPLLPSHVHNRTNLKRYLISKQFSTSQLINWSQIIFHVGTGVVFESFMKEKITVFPKYLTCNTLISNKYNAGLNLTNRDDLRNFCNLASKSIDNLRKDYSKKYLRSNKRFLSDFVYGNTKSVPDNIIKAVLSSIKNLEK